MIPIFGDPPSNLAIHNCCCKAIAPLSEDKKQSSGMRRSYVKPRTLATHAQTISSQPKGVVKTSAESDHELRRKLEEISGNGGESGVETKDGNLVAMKQSVRNNVFRYI